MECEVKQIDRRGFLFCREGLWVVSVEIGGPVTLFPPPDVSLVKNVVPRGWSVVVAEVRDRKFRPYGLKQFFSLPPNIPESIVRVMRERTKGAVDQLREEGKLEQAANILSKVLEVA
jgi:hypothetical protein